MKILVACEFTGAARNALLNKGHDAISCDLLPTESPGPHYQGDIRDILYSRPWDIIIAFPPCTHLAKAGAQYWKEKEADGRQQEAIDFFMLFVNHLCPRICIENPIGIVSRDYRKNPWPGWSMQAIQPWWFGDYYTKTTCLWLKALPPLMATKPCDPKYHWSSGSYRGGLRKDGTRKISALPCKWNNSSKNRSRTFPGVAQAMADQWG